MASRNGRGGAAFTPGGGRAPRRPTPTSPSPSPEPSSDVTRTSNSNATAFPFQQQGLASSDGIGSSSSTAGPSTILSSMDSAIGGSGSHAGTRNGGGVPGQTPFHHVLPLEEDPNEPYRQRAEDCTRNVIDSLYQLAVCAADIQPGREDIIGTKVNETITHLSSLSTSSSGSNADLLPLIPEELLEQIDEGRNPDAWSKNRMARLLSDNQQLAGQRWAIERYRERLAAGVGKVFPELEEVVRGLEGEHRGQRSGVVGVKEEEGGAEGRQGVEAGDVEMMGPPPVPSASTSS